ncbi:MAG: HAD family hydrolase [Sphingomonadales bacterium]|nr:HAD family hydrolase [Sphingomonadales bacterium]
MLPHELPGALDRFPHARVLSLDCFDTLLWRDCHEPRDIFARLKPVTPMQRAFAEGQARKIAERGLGRQEVSIGEIYAQLMPNATPAERAAAIAAEIAAEARHCHAFAPTVELMRRARARGLQVIIVSDTYLDAAQLRQLIADSAGEDVAALIDRVFVSSAHGKPKAGGLYGEVLRKLKAAPGQILHIGDNHGADVDGVAPFGVETLHLVQFEEATRQRLRLEASVSAMLHPQDDGEIAAQLPHRAACALAEPGLEDAGERFGHSVLGPVLAGYEIWLRDEAAKLARERGGRVHWLFMMRDGWLPMQVHAALSGTPADPAHAAEISRFTAIGASFNQDIAVQRYVERELGTEVAALAKQLLFSPAEIEALEALDDHSRASLALLADCRKAERKRSIVKASRALAQRLVAHVRKVADPAPGDTLMLVDLGYNGTVQNHVDALLQRELKVHVAGRYLLLREMDLPGLDKAGFIDSGHYDPATLEAMCANVAVLEQVCTTAMGSVVDYREDGTPIRRATTISTEQGLIRARVQAGTLRFAQACAGATQRRDCADQVGMWRRGVASVLGRLMYLPQPEELAVLETFEHDVNLGTARTVALFDPEAAARGLRQRGLFHLKASERMFLPAELAGQGLPSRLTLLAAKRFGLPLTFTDFAEGKVDLPVIFADAGGATLETIPAQATHDGWYVAVVPLGEARFTAALQFGTLYEWLQIDSLSFVATTDFLSEDATAAERQQPAVPIADGIEEAAPGLFRCADANAFLLVPPPAQEKPEQLLLLAVFRPIAPRTGA